MAISSNKGGHATPYIRSPKVQNKPSGAPFSPTPGEGLSKPHGFDVDPGSTRGAGNTRRGPH